MRSFYGRFMLGIHGQEHMRADETKRIGEAQ